MPAVTINLSTESVSGSFPDATQLVDYEELMEATGGTAPYSWSYLGTLPPGLFLLSAGGITGTPTANSAGVYYFSLQVTDANDVSVIAEGFSITVSSIEMATLYTGAFTAERERYFEDTPGWEEVTQSHVYQDGSKSFNELNDNPPRTWELIFTGLTPDEAEIFDTHYDLFRISRPFVFKDKKNIERTVYYKDFQRSHNRNQWWIQQRRVVLIQYAFGSSAEFLNDDESGLLLTDE